MGYPVACSQRHDFQCAHDGELAIIVQGRDALTLDPGGGSLAGRNAGLDELVRAGNRLGIGSINMPLR